MQAPTKISYQKVDSPGCLFMGKPRQAEAVERRLQDNAVVESNLQRKSPDSLAPDKFSRTHSQILGPRLSCRMVAKSRFMLDTRLSHSSWTRTLDRHLFPLSQNTNGWMDGWMDGWTRGLWAMSTYTYVILTCLHKLTYIHTYRHTYRQTNRKTATNPDTHTHTINYIHTYMHAYMRTYIHTYIHTSYIHACIHTHPYVHTHTRRHTYIHT